MIAELFAYGTGTIAAVLCIAIAVQWVRARLLARPAHSTKKQTKP